MDVRSGWYQEIAREIGRHKDWLDPKVYKRYKLELLLRVAVRLDGQAAVCSECHGFQPEIEDLVNDLSNLVQLPRQLARKERRHYFRGINEMVKHLQKEHNLVLENHYLGIGVAFGTAMSAGIGTALGSPGTGTGIGLALGLAIGKYLDNRAEKEGRVI